MDAFDTLFQEEFINEPNGKYQNSHAFSIVELPNGDLLASLVFRFSRKSIRCSAGI